MSNVSQQQPQESAIPQQPTSPCIPRTTRGGHLARLRSTTATSVTKLAGMLNAPFEKRSASNRNFVWGISASESDVKKSTRRNGNNTRTTPMRKARSTADFYAASVSKRKLPPNSRSLEELEELTEDLERMMAALGKVSDPQKILQKHMKRTNSLMNPAA